MQDVNELNNTFQYEITKLKEHFDIKQRQLEEDHKELLRIAEELRRQRINSIVPKETTIEQARKLGPMDDAFFSVLASDPGVMEEIISTVLGIPVAIKQTIPQYVIAGFGTRGVRLDSFSKVEPIAVARVELLADSIEFGKAGTLIDVEVQKQDREDTEYRVYYNGASVIIQNTPPGISDYREIPRAIIIWISSYDPFGKGKMYYQSRLVDAKSGERRNRPVSEIYINTEYADNSNDKMTMISKMLEIFKDNDKYNDGSFPNFSERKRNLKSTPKGVTELSKELQEYIDSEKEEARTEGQINTAKLMAWLSSLGRTEDIIKASEDESYLNKLFAEQAQSMTGTTV